MKAVVLRGPRRPELVSVDEPGAAPGQVLVRVLACGICGSDLNAWRGVAGVEYPLVPGAPGHEVWGEIVAVGARCPPRLRPGTRVTGLFSAGYAEFVVADAAQVVALPSPDGRPVLGEPLACAANVVRRAGVRPGERVALVGFGYLAALVAQLMSPVGGAGWVAVARRPESRQLASRMGAASVYGFGKIPSELWDSFDVVIEAAGAQETLDHATWLTRERGRLVIAGYHADGPRTVNMQSWNWKGLDVINAHERQPAVYLEGLRWALDVVARHELDPSSLITHTWPLDEFGEALAAAESHPPGYVKGMIVPQ